MITKMPTEKAIRRILTKKGHKGLLEKYDGYQRKLVDAISKGVVTEAEIQHGTAPREYMDIYSNRQKCYSIIQSHLNGAIKEIEAFSENPDADIEKFESDDVPEARHQPTPTAEQLREAYLQNPTRDNAAKMVKEKLLGKRNVDDRYILAEEAAARRTSEMVNHIRQQQIKENIADEKKRMSEEARMSAEEAQAKAVADVVASDRRLERKMHEPGNKYLGDRKKLVEERLKENEAALETLY